MFPAFPDRNQPERLNIFPGGMDALYRADQSNILKRAKYYTDKIGTTYSSQTKVTPAEAAAEYQKLSDALTSRTTNHTTRQDGSAAVDAEELKVCLELHRAYAGLLHEYFENPEIAYSFFLFPTLPASLKTATCLPCHSAMPELNFNG